MKPSAMPLVSTTDLVGPVNPTAASGRVKVSMEHPVTAATGVTRLRWRSTEGHRAEGRHVEGLDTEFVAFARRRGPHHLRTAVLLTGDWHTAEDLGADLPGRAVPGVA